MKLKTKLHTLMHSTQRISPLAGTAEETGGIPWWALIPSLLIIIAVLVWLWLRQETGKAEEFTSYIPSGYPPHPKIEIPSQPTAAATQTSASIEEARPTSSEKDDLKRIEGIGPKISSVFQNVGIHTFDQLAATETSRLEAILREAGIRIANPETWPEQAALAAKGDWDSLKILQEHLKGGRRV